MMRFNLALLFYLFLGILSSTSGYAQNTPYSKNRLYSSRPSRASVVCPIFDDRRYPYQGIGLKLGDPFALTYKFYASKNLAMAIDVGKTASGLYNRYYRNAFNAYLPDTLKANQDFQHIAHRVTSDIFMEGKFLYQWSAESLSKGLQLYAGLGWQWRRTSIQYDYLFDDNNTGFTKTGKFTESRFTYGPVGVVGFEYAYFSIPISAFIEIEWFSDVGLDPGYNRFQGGVGLRYVF